VLRCGLQNPVETRERLGRPPAREQRIARHPQGIDMVRLERQRPFEILQRLVVLPERTLHMTEEHQRIGRLRPRCDRGGSRALRVGKIAARHVQFGQQLQGLKLVRPPLQDLRIDSFRFGQPPGAMQRDALRDAAGDVGRKRIGHQTIIGG
jgi:hypothetical protein